MMQIHVGEDGEIVLSEIYNAIGIETDQANFGLVQRDGGIEVYLDGVLIWSSTATALPKLAALRDDSKRFASVMRELGERWKDANLPEHFARLVQERNERLSSEETKTLGVLLGMGWGDALGDHASDQGWTEDETVCFVAKLRRLGVVVS